MNQFPNSKRLEIKKLEFGICLEIVMFGNWKLLFDSKLK